MENFVIRDMGAILVSALNICITMMLFMELSFSFPLCTNSRPPYMSKTPLEFCKYNGSVCCNSTEDIQLQNQFTALNISDPGCSDVMKLALCSKCDPFSAELYSIDSTPRPVPVLCNSSSVSENVTNFCSKFWDVCQDISISNSPFVPQGGIGAPINSTSKLSDFFESKTTFCDNFGGDSDNGSVCFNGQPVRLNESKVSSPATGICLEKIGNGSYLNMVGYPDGSNRVFLSNQAGKIWLATVPIEGSGEILGLDESNPFLDLTDEVHYDSELGLMGIAFHPDFKRNGRFFVSFNCDKAKWQQCSGRCSCNSEVNCDPSKLNPDGGAQPCQYNSVIAEFTANGTTSQTSLASNAQHSEVRRIFTMGLPFTTHHGGQIVFGPEDGYLYFMMGDGGSSGDPYNFSQNKKSLLGKILRLDVDNIPSEKTILDLELWGHYSVPSDNPFSKDEELQPEIWALGFRNPWRCSFDLDRPSYFMCGDVGQDAYEEVNIVTAGGNYGWRVYEGPVLYHPGGGGNTSASSIDNPIFPVMGYNHSQDGSAASITAGYFYRSSTDPCLYGRYLYTDVYASSSIWVGTENPENSGNFSTNQTPIGCARNSPIQCDDQGIGKSAPSLGFVFSFGQDNRNDIFVLSSNGVYRIVRPSRCNYTCAKEIATPSPPSSAPSSPPPSNGNRPSCHLLIDLFLILSSTLLILL